MYYLIDEEGQEFEGTTLEKLLTQAKEEAYYNYDTFDKWIEYGEVQIFKGSRVKVKVIPPKYEEVKPVVPKKTVTKKPVAKAKR